jgi:hypothetical protein
MRTRYWTLANGPVPGWPQADTFVLKEGEVPRLRPGQALTRTIYVSLDPYQWGYKRRLTEPAGAPWHACTVSQVIESRMDGFAAGDFAFNTNGWTEYAMMGEGGWRPDYMVPRELDPSLGRISQAVGVLGMQGLTAYAGMNLMASPRAGETVVVSAASGEVGQIAGQLAMPDTSPVRQKLLRDLTYSLQRRKASPLCQVRSSGRGSSRVGVAIGKHDSTGCLPIANVAGHSSNRSLGWSMRKRVVQARRSSGSVFPSS